MACSSADTSTYPRPDWVRSGQNWRSLNGSWNFLFDDNDVGLLEGWHRGHWLASNQLLAGNDKSPVTSTDRTIQVPFVFQTPASGINERGAHEVLWYQRRVQDIRSTDERLRGDRVLLRFGAVDYEAAVWINGSWVGDHRGGHVPFEFDITDQISQNNQSLVTVRVRDSPFDLTQPRGKQYWGAEPESIFYTPCSGIWQSVWVEVVPRTRIADSSHGTILRANDIENSELHATVVVLGKQAGSKCSMEIEAKFSDIIVSTSRVDLPHGKNSAKLKLKLNLSSDQHEALSESSVNKYRWNDHSCWRDGLALWSPEYPQLYGIQLRLFDAFGTLVDEVATYAGMRSINWSSGDSTFKLNGQPFFQALVLDQGYWPHTGLTPPTPRSLRDDIVLSKEMGFNGCRKHQKVEDPIFLYHADHLGFLVWGEMANGYEFDEIYMDRFNQEWIEALRRDINHPCIVVWTPVNESWGYPSLKDNRSQRNHIRSLYYTTKALDPTRAINDNCGWEHVQTDLSTFHDYADFAELSRTCSTLDGILSKKSNREVFVPMLSAPIVDPGCTHVAGAPIICTEFGGVNIAQDKVENNKAWGYTTAANATDLLERIRNLVNAIVRGGHCCGFVYTQLTDIEQEQNGLLTFDRTEKLMASKVKAIMDDAQAAYFDLLRKADTKVLNEGG